MLELQGEMGRRQVLIICNYYSDLLLCIWKDHDDINAKSLMNDCKKTVKAFAAEFNEMKVRKIIQSLDKILININTANYTRR